MHTPDLLALAERGVIFSARDWNEEYQCPLSVESLLDAFFIGPGVKPASFSSDFRSVYLFASMMIESDFNEVEAVLHSQANITCVAIKNDDKDVCVNTSQDVAQTIGEFLGRWPQLRGLSLSGFRSLRGVLASLKAPREVQSVHIEGTESTNEDWELMSAMRNLISISIENCSTPSIADSVFYQFSELRNAVVTGSSGMHLDAFTLLMRNHYLNSLCLDSRLFNGLDLASLTIRFPNCKIVSIGGKEKVSDTNGT